MIALLGFYRCGNALSAVAVAKDVFRKRGTRGPTKITASPPDHGACGYIVGRGVMKSAC